MTRKYKRVLLKISGEAFRGADRYGIDVDAVRTIAREVASALKGRIQMAIVVGGGNIWRGTSDRARGIDRVTADYMGMMATLINAMALQDALEKINIPTRVQSAIEVAKLSEPYIRRRAIRHLEKGRVVIFAGGTGNPYFSTDTTAALRAVEIDANVLLKGTQVDGVYSDDPRTNPKAKLLTELTAMEAIRKRLRVMDTTAFSLCMENHLPVTVFNVYKPGNIRRVVNGEAVGTRINSQ
ncbi:MAG: UMP kinase [Elusimicrobiota bacterium]|jgi:uridylate kinase